MLSDVCMYVCIYLFSNQKKQMEYKIKKQKTHYKRIHKHKKNKEQMDI